ncbi:hypothetical protein TorRG33x02_288680 [Trema orientale]|uniref:Transmembrane protein n=1 Tax=Trema orientale TaxID=63057 RepID=A0A2P5CEG3_TREOI|nr:hypothetical protein TorRG33x02_288680 [Trema orientale]
MERSAKALLTLTVLLMAFMVRIEGGRDVPMKDEADADGPQHTLVLGGLGGFPWGVFPWLGLGLGLGNLVPWLGGLPWLGGHGGLFPWKKEDLRNEMKGNAPKGEGGAFGQSP